MKEIYIDRGITQSRIAVFIDNNLEELYVENHDNINLTGNVYLGRVENIASSLEAAFVNIGIGKNGILHVNETREKSELKIGKEIIVQVIREDSKDKGPKLSQNISIPGKLLVLLPNIDYIGVSKKIDGENREKIKELAQEIYINGYGLILRTESQFAKIDDIQKEYKYLIDTWEKNVKNAAYIKSPSLLYDIRDFSSFIVREYIKSDTDKVYLNRKKDAEILSDILSIINLYKNCEVIYNEYDFSKVSIIERKIKEILERKKLLSSGGNIVIDKTEALTVIDVNSGSIKSKESKEEYILNTNLEACKEIANTIRLGNMSGIIIIDFIDMRDEKSRQRVIKCLNEYLSKGSIQYKVYGFTKLGLLEMTRAKKGKSLRELIYNIETNNTYSLAYILKSIENQCLKISKFYKKYKFNVALNEDIYKEANNVFPNFISDMKDIYDIEINLFSSSGVQEFEINEV